MQTSPIVLTTIAGLSTGLGGALAVLCTVFGGTISKGEAVRKSCPNFFDTMKSLGFEAESGDII